MKRKQTVILIVVAAIIAAVFIKLRINKNISESRVYHFDSSKPVSVTVDTIRSVAIGEAIRYTGTFEPEKESKISADIQGKINAVLVDVGDFVKKGQTLVQLDNTLLKLQLQSVEIQIEGLENDVKRYTILTEADAVQGIQLEKSVLGLKSAKAQRASLMEQINKTDIKAPFAGVVTAKLNEEGGFAAPGVPLIQITDISMLRFTVMVPENELSKFESEGNYNIVADAFPDHTLSGKLTLKGSKANMGNSFPVQFQVSNTKSSEIRSGMFGSVSLTKVAREKGFRVPASSIITENNESKVYLVKNGKAILQTIVTGASIADSTVVGNGLMEGDLIITSGFINLFDQANVTIE